tara:strand:- start:354 stop:467 length:114 start_codon:yes stop_codon:yes gene_type:complete
MNFYDYFESVPVFLCAVALVPCAFVIGREAIEVLFDL